MLYLENSFSVVASYVAILLLLLLHVCRCTDDSRIFPKTLLPSSMKGGYSYSRNNRHLLDTKLGIESHLNEILMDLDLRKKAFLDQNVFSAFERFLILQSKKLLSAIRTASCSQCLPLAIPEGAFCAWALQLKI